MNKPTVEQLAELAKQVEIKDPIDWAGLKIGPETAYPMMASHVIENFTGDDKQTVALAVITKLLVENFILHLRLLQKG